MSTDPWQPTRFHRYLECVESSTGVARIVTDAGEAYIKALGNREGPHALAREWVGTSLAKSFGLRAFEFAMMTLTESDEIQLGHERKALPGTAFVSKKLNGHPWSGKAEELDRLINPEDIFKLVVFDTWILNVDRYPPTGIDRKPNYDNVFLSTEGLRNNKLRLIAINHTHCFGSQSELHPLLANIQYVKDERIHGLFPVFKSFLSKAQFDDVVTRLSGVTRQTVSEIVDQIPQDWDVNPNTKESFKTFLCDRAAFLAAEIERLLTTAMGNEWG